MPATKSRLSSEFLTKLSLSTIILPFYDKPSTCSHLMLFLSSKSRKLWLKNIQQWQNYFKDKIEVKPVAELHNKQLYLDMTYKFIQPSMSQFNDDGQQVELYYNNTFQFDQNIKTLYGPKLIKCKDKEPIWPISNKISYFDLETYIINIGDKSVKQQLKLHLDKIRSTLECTSIVDKTGTKSMIYYPKSEDLQLCSYVICEMENIDETPSYLIAYDPKYFIEMQTKISMVDMLEPRVIPTLMVLFYLNELYSDEEILMAMYYRDIKLPQIELVEVMTKYYQDHPGRAEFDSQRSISIIVGGLSSNIEVNDEIISSIYQFASVFPNGLKNGINLDRIKFKKSKMTKKWLLTANIAKADFYYHSLKDK